MKIRYLILFFLALAACDQVDQPYIEQGDYCGHDDLSIPIRKILVEDYTGHRCGNCPAAAAKMEELKATFCDHIVPVSIHATAAFAAPNSSGAYTYDFRTPAGNQYESFFDVNMLPNGMVNRTALDGNRLLAPDSWATAVAAILQTPPEITISIDNSFDDNSLNVSTNIRTELIQDMNQKLSLSVFLVEDSIVNWQKDYEADPVDIENYTHRHVLRQAINTPWGEEILNGSIAQGESLEKNYTFALSPEYKPAHCSIVAFVFNTDSKEVIQAEAQKLVSQ